MSQTLESNKRIFEYSATYEDKKQRLLNLLKNHPHTTTSLKKKTASNLFRYASKTFKNKKTIMIKEFDHILAIDTQQKFIDVEGMTTFEKIVHSTLNYQLLPMVAPELKHITIGGAIVGIGIESTSFKYGFVHDGLLAAEVLLPTGDIVLCTPDNEHADLFYALPNSYGTLGYILRAKYKLYSAKPFVTINIQRFNEIHSFLEHMKNAVENQKNDFIEGLSFSQHEHYLMLSEFIDSSSKVDNIYHHIFYKMVRSQSSICLTTEDYIFRYDPDWFWNFPETHLYNLFRQFAPKSWRNSGLYKKYIDLKHKLFSRFTNTSETTQEETLIQDWEVPWNKGADLFQYALDHINISDKPWVSVPIKPMHSATLYPLQPHELYFNLGCYCTSKKLSLSESFHNTKLMDSYCFSQGGIKMLYSSTFISPDKFATIYNGVVFNQLKMKYDPLNLNPTLYQKTGCIS